MGKVRYAYISNSFKMQQQRELERRIERRIERERENKIIQGDKGVAFEVWRDGNATYIQILKNGLSKGTYGRLVYQGNSRQLQSDLTHALTLTCQLDFTIAAPITTNFLRDLNKWIKEIDTMTPNTYHTHK